MAMRSNKPVGWMRARDGKLFTHKAHEWFGSGDIPLTVLKDHPVIAWLCVGLEEDFATCDHSLVRRHLKRGGSCKALTYLDEDSNPLLSMENTVNTKSTDVEFQQRVKPWLLKCFGQEVAADQNDRNHRFLEEALELVQSLNCTKEDAHKLVDYVFGRPLGDPPQEVGGVMVSLAALCLANNLDMHDAGEVELARVWTKIDQIRAKQAAKPKQSPLPGFSDQTLEKVVPTEPTKSKDEVVLPVVFHGSVAGGYGEMVNRFLGWSLPKTFAPDAGIKFEPSALQLGNEHSWPVGTNLLTASQALDMFRHCVPMGPASSIGTVERRPLQGNESTPKLEVKWKEPHKISSGELFHLPVMEQLTPIARVAEVHMSRYTLEWLDGPLPEGTLLFAL